MKVMTISLVAAIIAGLVCCGAAAAASPGRDIEKKWKKYQEIPGDNPRDRIAALEQIRDACEALAPSLARDNFRPDKIFFDAVSELRSCRTEINWKERDAAAEEFNAALQRYPRPYPLARYILGGSLYGAEREKVLAQAHTRFADSWPNTAEAMIQEAEQLSRKMWQIRTEADAMALRDLCKDFQRRKDALKGIDACFGDLLSGPSSMLETLESKSIEQRVQSDTLYIETRNLESVKVKVSSKDPSYSLKRSLLITSPKYYVRDSLALPLEGVRDGLYKILVKSRKEASEIEFERTSISLAGRWRDGVYEIYAAGMTSGEPVRTASVRCRLWDDKKPGKPAGTWYQDISLDGFTPIPQKWADAVSDSSHIDLMLTAFDAAGQRILSRTVDIFNHYKQDPRQFTDSWRSALFTDCGIFRPGDRVHFKAIVYTSRKDKSIILVDRGRDVTVELLNPKGEVNASCTLATGELGSVDGCFDIPAGDIVTGRWRLRLLFEGRSVISRDIVVDDYVAPSFEVTFTDGQEKYYRGETVVIKGLLKSYSGNAVSTEGIKYTLWGDKEQGGVLHPASDGSFSLSVPTGENTYSLCLDTEVTDARGETLHFSHHVVLVDREEEAARAARPKWERTGRGGVSARMANIAPGTWAVVELWGPDQLLLYSSLRTLDDDIDLVYEDHWPEDVRLTAFWFKDAGSHSLSVDFSRPRPSLVLPLEWDRTAAGAGPGEMTAWSVSTVAGAEVAVAVFDKSTLELASNDWPLLVPKRLGVYPVNPDINCGSHNSNYYPHRGGGRPIIMMKSAARTAGASADGLVMFNDAVESAVTEESEAALADDSGAAGVHVRSEIAEVLAFYPALRAGADGKVSFDIPASDKLSTYIVRVYAHDATGRSSVMDGEFTVSLDTEVSVLSPRFLYDGDRYVLHYSVTSRDSVVNHSRDFGVVRRSGGPALDFVISADALAGSKGDALRVSIPIKENSISVTEAHSAIFSGSRDVAAMRDSLVSAFANDVSGAEIEFVEETLKEGVLRYLDSKPDAEAAENAVALSGALFYKDADTRGLLTRLHALRGADGGYSWMSGMKASAAITALVMERLHLLGLDGEISAQTVQWLDAQMGSEKTVWLGGLSDAQYFYVRSMYPRIAYQQKRQHTGLLKDEGGILFKARRVLTLRNLDASDEGRALARKWGVSQLMTRSRLEKQIETDVYALRQYAVVHPCGGTYFPNAVMPWRGLQENEIYAHTLLCRVFREDNIGDGLRLWMMVQKQTQAWRSSPNMIEACKVILEGSESVLATRMITASAVVSTPIEALKASTNGMSVVREWQIHDGKEWRSIADGEILRRGQQVRVVSRLWSQENRSFVRLSSPIPACLAPVDQLSGWRWWGSYRQVRSDAVECYWDSFPEEKTTVTELYTVTQEGRFIIPEAAVECLYAPAWRGSEAFAGYMTSE